MSHEAIAALYFVLCKYDAQRLDLAEETIGL
jgi:hypothetical protein